MYVIFAVYAYEDVLAHVISRNDMEPFGPFEGVVPEKEVERDRLACRLTNTLTQGGDRLCPPFCGDTRFHKHYTIRGGETFVDAQGRTVLCVRIVFLPNYNGGPDNFRLPVTRDAFFTGSRPLPTTWKQHLQQFEFDEDLLDRLYEESLAANQPEPRRPLPYPSPRSAAVNHDKNPVCDTAFKIGLLGFVFGYVWMTFYCY
jgi:hypothetical protein